MFETSSGRSRNERAYYIVLELEKFLSGSATEGGERQWHMVPINPEHISTGKSILISSNSPISHGAFKNVYTLLLLDHNLNIKVSNN